MRKHAEELVPALREARPSIEKYLRTTDQEWKWASETLEKVAAQDPDEVHAEGFQLRSQVREVSDAAVQLGHRYRVEITPPDCGRKLVQGLSAVLPARRDTAVHERDGFGAAALEELTDHPLQLIPRPLG